MLNRNNKTGSKREKFWDGSDNSLREKD